MVDMRLFGIVYLYVVAAMISSAFMVTNFGFGFEDRLPQVGIAAVLGLFWTAYYVWSIHPKLDVSEEADTPDLTES